jgi:hypothetical protein
MALVKRGSDFFHSCLQNLVVDTAANAMVLGGTIQFAVSINEGSEFLLNGSIGSTQYYTNVEVTITEDDRKLHQLMFHLMITITFCLVAMQICNNHACSYSFVLCSLVAIFLFCISRTYPCAWVQLTFDHFARSHTRNSKLIWNAMIIMALTSLILFAC